MAAVFIYSDKPQLAAELVSFARQSSRESVVLVFSQEEASALAECGADKIYCLQGDSPLPESYAKATAALLQTEKAALFAVGSTARGRDLAARVAGTLDCAMISDITSVEFVGDGIAAARMLYGGAVIQSEQTDGFAVITVPAGKFEAAAGIAPVSNVPAAADSRVTLVERSEIAREGVDLTGAERVVCVGLGMDKADDMQMAAELATTLQAEIACTRGVAEERHWLPADRYIGISGAVVKPQLYLSLGVSGQVQHVYGIRDARIIAAIDASEKAPIFRAADYGIVGDMYEIVPLLIAALKNG